MNHLKCVLVMPAYNEEECIEQVVNGWISEFSRQMSEGEFKVLVVDDGSTDQTSRILDKVAGSQNSLIVLHQSNAGHGKALISAYRKAVGLDPDYVFHVDSDDQFIPEDFTKLWECRFDSKFILGFREIRHDAINRLIITKILRLLIFLFFGCWIKDANVPYRLIQADYLRYLLKVLPSNVFAPNVYLAILAAKDGRNIISVPVTHKKRNTGLVSIVRWKLIKVCLRSLRELINFRVNFKMTVDG